MVQYSWLGSLVEPQCVADHPDAGVTVAAKLVSLAESPLREHVESGVVVGLRGIQNGVRDGHRRRGAHQRERTHALGMSRCTFERDKAAQRVADQRGLGELQRIQHLEDPSSHGLNARQRAPGRTPVTRQIYRDNVIAMPGEVTAREGPDRVIHTGAVDEDNAGFRGVDVPRVGVAIGRLSRHLNMH